MTVARSTEEARAVMARLTAKVYTEEWLEEFMESVKDLQKGVRVENTCQECGTKRIITAQVPDFKNILDSVVEFFNQSYGRPATADGEPGGVTIVLQREWPGADRRDSAVL